ncbi:hypothetical protein Wcon_00453 [Wolbachia endosymbiont of Cylisticus convexus]|uniref:hypothetical protein n=1 Tax=Wolbachia endosymbiont of Cylisticus convexus TaxID=118728 RepID=UPI000DF71E27|nr:hypothetical protein [Wolbachia endosymbiont of Cylisticus convexus]RDD35387.1 hypothetical protein Wcon_00453 [Wolbachia endosymbiont of Cylisticus convexus]
MPKSTQNALQLPTLMDSENEAPILYTNYDCHRICEKRHNGDLLEGICKKGCDFTNLDLGQDQKSICMRECTTLDHRVISTDRKCYNKCMSRSSEAPQDDYSQEPTPINISNILIDIRDNFYDLANNFHNLVDSVLL